MDNFGQLQPTGEEPIGHGEDDDLFDEVDMDETYGGPQGPYVISLNRPAET